MDFPRPSVLRSEAFGALGTLLAIVAVVLFASSAHTVLLAATGGLALLALLAAALSRMMFAPIHRLARAAAQVGDGKLGICVPGRQRGEVGGLLRAFNAMSRSLEQRELSVRLTEERFQGILDNANAAIYVKDADSRYLLVNREFERIRGLKSEEVLGRSEDDIGPLVTASQIRASDREVIESASAMSFEQELATHDGTRTYLSLKFPIRSENGKVIALAGISTDLTGQTTTLAQAIETSRLKSGFVANMSHEIRTPLNGVVGMASLLSDTPLDPVQRGYVEALEAASRALLAVINDILDFSKIEAGQLELDPTDFELRGCVAEACLILAQQAHAHGLESSYTVAADLPTTVNGDRGRLSQVLLNLLSNAIKFTASGEVLVSVSGGAANIVRFEVSDTGVGIDADQAARLFEPFEQADQSTTRLFGGTGIGLTIAREIAQRMGGAIGAEPRACGGSTFWFTAKLPAAAALPRPRHAGAAADAVTDRPSHRERAPRPTAIADPGWPLVLIAEDDRVNDAVACALLAKQGLRAVVAHNGREAVEMALATDYAAILMDCQMPEIDGYEATRRIRDAEHGRHVPIIAMTAHSMTGDRERCLEAGMDDYVSKPVRPEELAAVMTHQLSGGEQTPQLRAASGRAQPAPGAAVGGPASELFDEAVVRELRQALAMDERQGLIHAFIASLAGYVAEIVDASRRGDTSERGRVAHLLGGSGASLGAKRLALSCQRLEQSGSDQDPAVGAEQLAELDAAATLTRVALPGRLL
ncbi:MAG TPA: ATP-binding protein [Solirubrobacteraceae bacterium]|jgi:PAS domain S-box-containing protein|nr:ATP-binding protein [Solirubrobacteraceae bacterium]